LGKHRTPRSTTAPQWGTASSRGNGTETKRPPQYGYEAGGPLVTAGCKPQRSCGGFVEKADPWGARPH